LNEGTQNCKKGKAQRSRGKRETWKVVNSRTLKKEKKCRQGYHIKTRRTAKKKNGPGEKREKDLPNP